MPNFIKHATTAGTVGAALLAIFNVTKQYSQKAKKTFANGQGLVALDVNDLLYSDRNKTTYTYQNIQQETATKWQSRTIKLTLNYMFGNSKVALTNKRESTIEEQGRLK